MKIYTFKHFWIILFLSCTALYSQNSPNLEFATAQGTTNPTGNGPVYNTSVNFVKNVDNPLGTIYNTYLPNLKVDFVISNLQYNAAVMIGYNINNTSVPVFSKMNYIGTPNNSDFTSSGTQVGKGMNVSANKGVAFFYNTAVLIGKATHATYQMADLTITFNRPVDNPIFHLGALGAFKDQLGIAGGFELVESNVPVSFVRLSGNNSNFSVNSTSIKNTSLHPNDIGSESASGSVLVKGHGISSVKLRLSVLGDGGELNWTTGSGDLITFGISVLESDLAISTTVDNNTPQFNDIVKFTIKARNHGASNNSGVVVNNILPDGYEVLNASTGSGTYDINTGLWNIGDLDDNMERELIIQAKVKNMGSYTVTSSIIGEIHDPQISNNKISITPAVSARAVCYNDPNTHDLGTNSKFGITLLKRAGGKEDDWPMTRKSAHLVLESNSKGFVITRLAKSGLNNIVIPVEGMIIYDTTDKCLKVYSDNQWSCFSQPTCP
ncbi:DUF11 domain-containing protein [Chryseobacterium sp. CKR4-1]|uniref:DUF11 domain-containing protein n=1 Tax=Chryseobacterium sp. CKR4-1 TaxID=3068896 RepID=UPI0027967C90|nr:DUF11 domain-containing protein [Chryseobacterium sp. CKR4-1]MDQ1805096.1 DUF11 domain-containing protein [Chryseobacterium sp. CKR4-1]